MDLRDQWRKKRLNDLIRKEELDKSRGKTTLVGAVAVAILLGSVLGSMCHRYFTKGDDYNPVQSCITRHYQALNNKPTPEQQKYIREACRQYE